MLVTQLRYLDPTFESYAVERMAQLHLAVPRRYQVPNEHDQGFRASKLIVYAAGPTDEDKRVTPEVVAGWYLEKGNGTSPFGVVDDLWDWPYFVTSLRDDAFRDELSQVVARHDLRIGAYYPQTYGPEDTPGWIGRLEDGDLVIRTAPQADAAGNPIESSEPQVLGHGWGDLIARLGAAPVDRWWDLHIWKSWPKDDALAGGRTFAFDELSPVLRDLAGCYLDVVRAALAEPTRSADSAGHGHRSAI